MATVATACCVPLLPERQIWFWPVDVLRHRMSETPSPLKSPTPTTCQALLATVAVACCVPLLAERQIVFWPVAVLRHRMSETPSPLKSFLPRNSGTTIARKVAMIGMVMFMLRTLSDWFATPVARPATLTEGFAKLAISTWLSPDGYAMIV